MLRLLQEHTRSCRTCEHKVLIILNPFPIIKRECVHKSTLRVGSPYCYMLNINPPPHLLQHSVSTLE